MSVPQATIPLWQTVLSILGFSSLIASVLAHWLSSRRERLRWVGENKKAEWRELIDQLDQSLTAMGYAFVTVNVVSPDGSNDPQEGITKGNRVIRDRIFIADAVRKYGVLESWEELVKYTSEASITRSPSQHGANLVGWLARVNRFQEGTLQAARKDLGL